MTFIKSKISLVVLLAIITSLVIYRGSNVLENEISWDAFGYYLPLEATFVANDPGLNNLDWLQELNAQYQFTGTFYQISYTEKGEPMYFFLFGMSFFYSIFFFIGDFLAGLLGYSQDGLSLPYQYSLVYGCMIYTIVGLIFLRKILKTYFTDGIVAIILLVIVFATNYVNHMSLKNLETVNVLFMLMTILIWNTIKWYENFKFKNLLVVGVSIALMTLVKPSEVLIVLLPLLWGVKNRNDLKERVNLIMKHKWKLLLTALFCLLLMLPQMLYWYSKTGHFIYDTYKNPGVGLDIFSPHIIESLFSYRKGWLLYTPVMFLFLFGFFTLYKNKRELFYGLLIPFLISFYIIVSWTEYWYGAGFSNRPLITQYPILAIPFGYLLMSLQNKSLILKSSVIAFVLFCTFLNQFQWWQYKNYILDPYRTTKEYYFATFLKTSVSEEDREKLLVFRDFTGEMNFTNKEDYNKKLVHVKFFPKLKDESGNPLLYAETTEIPYNEISNKDHFWVHFTGEYYGVDSLDQNIISVMIKRKEGEYAAKYFTIPQNIEKWNRFDFWYLTPEMRSHKDLLKFFIWTPKGDGFVIQNFRIEAFEPK